MQVFDFPNQSTSVVREDVFKRFLQIDASLAPQSWDLNHLTPVVRETVFKRFLPLDASFAPQSWDPEQKRKLQHGI